MKNLIFLMFFVLGAIGVACQDQGTPSKTERFREIAMSGEYTQYQENFYDRAFAVATNAIDLQAVDSLFRQYPEKQEIVDFDRDLFKNIKGGLTYYEIELKTHNLGKLLNEKYHFDKLSFEESAEIGAIFDKQHNGHHKELLREKIADYFKNKSK
jgi:hypothetical protein